jgi:S-adenosyl-L-methionine hydrolase (adenosine-forming)
VPAAVITFLSDYGLGDDFAGVCHGVIATICPEARVIDITHGVPRHDVRAGALILRSAIHYTPTGVHLAVVDPDVGARRRAVALRTGDDRLFVGPDNGLLSLAAEAAGGVIEAVDIAESPWRLEPVSATFHGRDIFAPVAARLAAGEPLAHAGQPCDPDGLVKLQLPQPRREDGALIAHAVYVDRFGNVQLNVGHDHLVGGDSGLGVGLGDMVELEAGSYGRHRAHYVRTFADVREDELMLYEDANQTLAVAVSRGNAAARLGLAPGDELWIRAV